ncbi:MAG: hypothetical protein CMJ53_01580 [Planctomycetaceae bacterium]|nr:hypothetical protein [Planctomycetaceae bacterium]|tara:strand:- start:95 stop:763 length:669 start_codon:yes stop_codon:yes gene_type:complete
MTQFKAEDIDQDDAGKWGMPACAERLRVRLGASQRQFMVFGLLLLTGGVMMARPAGMLLWHRLRIISGMPRTAIADQDPKIIAAQTGPAFEPVSEGREIQLDVSLLRDPFDTPSLQPVQVVTTLDDESLITSAAPARISPEQSRLVEAISSIRLTGTAKGLGTALVDGSVRTIGTRFDVSDYTFQLIAVHAGAIHLEVVENPVFNGWRCIVNREGATLLPSE